MQLLTIGSIFHCLREKLKLVSTFSELDRDATKSIIMENNLKKINIDRLIYELTEEFLEDFFGTFEYFDVGFVINKAKPLILARIESFKKYVTEHPKIVEHIMEGYDYEDFEFYEPTPSKEEITECYWIYHTLENLFVQDLFHVTSIPIKFACDLNKGEYPNGDLSCGHKAESINLEFNRQLLKIAYQNMDVSLC